MRPLSFLGYGISGYVILGYGGVMKHITLTALLLLTGCGSSDETRTAGGVTAVEARALDDAAAMVEAKRVPPEAIPSVAPVVPAPAAPAPVAPAKGQ